jgi:hypothetical protein
MHLEERHKDDDLSRNSESSSLPTQHHTQQSPLEYIPIITMKFTTVLFALVAPVFALQEASILRDDVNLEFSALKSPQVGDTLELLLEAINGIPDDVLLAGDEATNVSHRNTITMTKKQALKPTRTG